MRHLKHITENNYFLQTGGCYNVTVDKVEIDSSEQALQQYKLWKLTSKQAELFHYLPLSFLNFVVKFVSDQLMLFRYVGISWHLPI